MVELRFHCAPEGFGLSTVLTHPCPSDRLGDVVVAGEPCELPARSAGIIFGRIGDKFGRKRAFAMTILLTCVELVQCGCGFGQRQHSSARDGTARGRLLGN